ncbi:MAG TPA: RIP metalloprotease RseP [Alphaproteobacteria bacterium]|nr:RIP metalloprotease RseP [Alphaproteobacteria bacterium]
MWLLNSIYYIIPFIILLSILVFVHEFGHFFIARLCGVHVSAFSIGFGKELWGRTDKHGTKWKISAIPLGGYCQFLGDGDASSSSTEGLDNLTDEQKKHAFAFQNPFKKLAIVLAGPGFNYLFAILIYFVLFASFGKFSIPPVVSEVMEGGAAKAAGILPGDRFVNINGIEVKEWGDISREVLMDADHYVSIDIVRDGKPLHFDISLVEMDKEQIGKTTQKQYMLGVKSKSAVEFTYEKLSISQAFIQSCAEVWDVTAMTLRGVGQMITGRRGSDDVGGIIRIAEMTGDITKNESFVDFITFLALLSINLGLINLFPIPVLDGGHVVIFILEIITGREINEKVKEYLFKAGFLLLVGLMILATKNDIVHLINRLFNS